MAEEAIVTELTEPLFYQKAAEDPKFVAERQKTEGIKDWLLKYIDTNLPEKNKERAKEIIANIIILEYPEGVIKELQKSYKTDSKKYAFTLGYYDDFTIGTFSKGRIYERKLFDRELAALVEESGGKVTRQALFDAFATAHFTGKYLPLARIIEGIRGPGSFRKMAEHLSERREREESDDKKENK